MSAIFKPFILFLGFESIIYLLLTSLDDVFFGTRPLAAALSFLTCSRSQQRESPRPVLPHLPGKGRPWKIKDMSGLHTSLFDFIYCVLYQNYVILLHHAFQ